MSTNKTLCRYVRIIIIIIASMSLDHRDIIIRYTHRHTHTHRVCRISRTRSLSIEHINLIQTGSFTLLFSRQFTGQDAHDHRFTYSRAHIYIQAPSFIDPLFHPLFTYTYTYTHGTHGSALLLIIYYIIMLLSSHAEGTKNVKQTNRTNTGNERDISRRSAVYLQYNIWMGNTRNTHVVNNVNNK